MANAVYVLCFLTSAAVALLLLRAYWRTGTRILLWSGLGFIGLCLNNLMLTIDLVAFPEVQITYMAYLRSLPTLIGMAILVFGLIWESE